MKHRWFLIAAYGWLLLQPPPKLPVWTSLKNWLGLGTFTATMFDPDVDAPYSRWKYLGSYDTAKECQNAWGKQWEIERRSDEKEIDKQYAYRRSLYRLKHPLHSGNFAIAIGG